MNKLKVITGRKSAAKKEPKYLKYLRAIEKFANKYPEFNGDDNELLKKFIYLQVKSLSVEKHKCNEVDEIELLFSRYSATTDLLAMLTPIEFMQMFPIAKNYDGKKHQMKDYFSTMVEINKLDLNKPIGEDEIMYFLWDYHNWDITKFEVYKMSAMSDLRRCQGEKGLMEEFCEQNNIPTYSHYEKLGILVENGTGKSIKIKQSKKRKPKYLMSISRAESLQNEI